MTYKHLLFERSEGIAYLTLNRPDRLNAYSLTTVDEFHEICDQLTRDLSSRVVVLTGAGRAFCAGLDMKDGAGRWSENLGPVQETYEIQRRLATMVIRLRELPQPVIAAIHGPAVGGGLALAAAADIRIADNTARFGAAFVRLGLSAGDDGTTWFLPRIVGPANAADILYTGRIFEADEALRMGFVRQVTDAGADGDAAVDFARQMLENSPFGTRMTKELLNLSLGVPALRQFIDIENRTQVLCSLTEDSRESFAAFAQHRSVTYTDH